MLGKQVRKSTGHWLFDLLLHKTPWAKQQKEKINKLDLIKIISKSFKWNYQEVEKIIYISESIYKSCIWEGAYI